MAEFGLFNKVEGRYAHNSSSLANPVVLGAEAVEYGTSSTLSKTSEGDNTRLRCTTDGRLLVQDWHPFIWSVLDTTTSAVTNKSLRAAPGSGRSLFVTDIMFSAETTGYTVKLVEDTGGTPADKTCTFNVVADETYHIRLSSPIQITANKDLGITTTGANGVQVMINGFTASST